MYVPQAHEERDIGVLHGLIRAHPLGAWVVLGDGELIGNHLPFRLDAERGPFGTLVAHVARANPVWRQAPGAVPSLVMFQGPEAYITPSWYPAKAEHGKVVPTWNYAVVHAYGLPRVIEDRAWLLREVSALTELHETAHHSAWRVTDAPPEYIVQLLEGIVGIEIPLQRVVGKWKTSQNRSMSDQHGVVAGLGQLGTAPALAMAAEIRSRLEPGTGEGQPG